MNTIENIILQCKEATANPKKAIDDFYKETGKKSVGCFPLYCPEEIVHAAGMLPVGIWGGQVDLNMVRSILPAFACSIMQSVMEFQLQSVYDSLVAVIIPSPCDTLKAIGQKWSRENVPCIQFVPPHNRQLKAARVFLKEEYKAIRDKLEAIIGEAISDEAIQESIKVYNEHRQVMRKFANVAAKYPDIIDPVSRHEVMKSAFFMRKEKHTALVKALISELNTKEVKPWGGLKTVVSGIMLEPTSVIEVFKEFNIAITADDLAQESRQYRVDIPEGDDVFDAMAGMWQEMYGCSLAFETDKSRVKMLREMKEKYEADAVIICMMKFCDPEEFDYPIIKKEMEYHDIPLLQIEIDQQVQYVEQIRTRIQSFTEILQESK